MAELVPVEFDPFKSPSNPKDFAARYGSAAEKAGKALGVDPQVLLGQWGLETGWGKSVVPGTNNLGNIKDFSGSGTTAKDNMTGSVDKYRAYESPDAFVDDFVSLVQRKYPKAVGAKDPLAFATALKEGGYAEDPRYVDKVVQASRMAKPMNPVMAAGKAIADAVIPSAQAEVPAGGWGKRADGTQKGNGFLGVLKRPDGNVSTEISVGVNIDGKDVEIPTLVPTLTAAEREALLSLPDGQMPPEAIIRKAAAFARQRMAQGKSPFAQAEESPQDPSSSAEPQLVPVDFDPFAKKEPESKGMLATAREGLNVAREATTDLGKGFIRGAARIGNTITNAASQPVVPDGSNPLINPDNQAPAVNLRNAERQAGLAAYDREAPNSLAYQAGDLTAQIAGTAGAGGALAAPLKAAGVLPKFANALQSGGMTVGGAPVATVAQGAGNLLTRAAGGAAAGGASAGLVDPSQAGLGAAIGGALPVVAKGAAVTGSALGRSLSGGQLAPEVKALADRAKQLGIDIPADRLVDSKPLNALAASLDYVPGSGRTATMNKMEDQLNRAVSRTFGQDSPNVTQALRKASDDLGTKFDAVLSKNTVKVDNQFLTDLADASSMASKELGSDGARIISNQIDEIIAKAAQTGDIDGQAAYNIKKTLDRIGRRNSPEAFYALDLKGKLMEALNRSLGPAEAQAFSTVRKQYGNMLAMEKIANNGAEGGVSIARLANMKNINNAELQELADISAQFLKSREGAHGAAQRVGAGALTLGLTGPGGLAAGMATGRGANMLLNSNAVKNRLMGNMPTNRLLGEPELGQLIYRGAPVAGSQ